MAPTTKLTQAELLGALAQPNHTLSELDRLDCEDSLLEFIRYQWDVLEPGRTFVEGWAVEAICEHLEAVTNGELRHLLINVPPGCMKSLTTCVFWPAWEWGPRNLPAMRYVCASYSQDLTVRDNRRARHVMISDRYQAQWGDRFDLVADQNAKVRYDTSHTGFKIATSVAGLGTGERGDRFIIDDPHNIKDGDSDAKREAALQWFTEVVPTRLNDADKSAIVVIMQRVHERDVSGLILAQELGYEHLMLPMEFEKERACVTSIGFEDPRREEGELLWPERFSNRYVQDELKPTLRAWGGTYAEAGQLQQSPVPRGGGMFKAEDFQYVDSMPDNIVARVRGWDLAATKDAGAYTVGLLMSRDKLGRIYVEHVRRLQGSPKEVEDALTGCANNDLPGTVQDIPQDPGQAGKAQKAHHARLLHGTDVHFSPETGSKEDRAKPLAAQAEAGNLFLVRAPWNDALVNECKSFPFGQFKDQVDAASRAYARLAKPANLVGAAPRVVTSG